MKTLFIKFLFFALLFGCFSINLFAQKMLTGKVIDSKTTDPLVGATVSIKGTGIGTLTNEKGEFSLKTPEGSHILLVTYVGYKKQELPISEDYMEIKMEFSDISLDEVVITGLATEKEIKSLSYSVSEISAEPIESQSNASLPRKLAGKATGVNTNSSPISIRGVASVKRRLRMKSIAKRRKAIIPDNKTLANQDIENESYESLVENAFKSVEDEALSTFSIDVDKASYANVRRFLNDGMLPPPDAVRSEELINYFTYSYPEPQTEHPISLTTELSTCPWNAKNQVFRIGLKGKSLDMTEAPKSNLVFLLDVSGSMNSANKLPLLKQSFSLLTDNLREEDRVAIVVYAGASGVVLPSTSGKKKEKILEALDRLSAGGSTAGAAGLRQAYEIAAKNFIKKGNNRVILATDGDFNVGESSDDAMVKLIEAEREKGIFLSVLGFGTGNYKDSKMEKIADKGNGNYAYIDNLLEAKKVLVNEMSGTLYTIAKDVKLQIEFNPEYVKSYRLIGYENRMLAKEDFNDDTKDAGEMGAGHTVTALYELVPAKNSKKDKMVAAVDPLKYQAVQRTEQATQSGEVLTVKFRYKDPQGDTSKLLTHAVKNSEKEFASTSEDFRFSAAVANFGMLLRKSDFAKKSTFEEVISLAKESKGADEEGYRAEFIRLVELAELLSQKKSQ